MVDLSVGPIASKRKIRSSVVVVLNADDVLVACKSGTGRLVSKQVRYRG